MTMATQQLDDTVRLRILTSNSLTPTRYSERCLEIRIHLRQFLAIKTHTRLSLKMKTHLKWCLPVQVCTEHYSDWNFKKTMKNVI